MDEFCTFCVCSVSTCDAIWVSFPSPLSDRSDPGGVSNSGGELMIWSVSVKKERKKEDSYHTFWVLFVNERRSSINISAVASIDFRGS